MRLSKLLKKLTKFSIFRHRHSLESPFVRQQGWRFGAQNMAFALTHLQSLKEKRAQVFVVLKLHDARKSKDRVRSVHVGLVRFIIPSGDTATVFPETWRNAEGCI